MTIGRVRGNLLLLGVSLACAGTASGYESMRPNPVLQVPVAAAASLYELADPLPLSSARWDPLFDSRFELAAGLLPRHEVRFSAASRGRSPWDGSDLGFGLAGVDSGWLFDPLRATYRYTFLEHRDWAWKVGVTARLDSDSLRSLAPGTERVRFSGLPLVHFAGQGRLAQKWLLTVDAEGLLTARGRALDIGVRVNYALSRSFSLFGGYRLSDHYLEGDESSLGLTNSANVGLRYRF
jgi:hypothetical protein